VYKGPVVRNAALASLLILASCKDCDDQPKTTAKDAAPPPEPSASAPPIAIKDAGPPVDAAATEEIYGEAGTSSCRLAYGPAEQPFRGPATLTVEGNQLDLIANEGGRPHVFNVPIGPKKGKLETPPKPATYLGMRWPPCELAGKFVYCTEPGGSITRGLLGSTDFKKIPNAKVRNNTRLAAALLDPEHSVVTWLETRETTEGKMLKAFASLDLSEPVRLSEDGAGATSIRFLPRKAGAMAVYIDTRTNQVPVHARPVSFKENALSLGTDVVLTVGGVPERGLDFEVAYTGQRNFALIPMPSGITDFGMATVGVDDPPKEDISIEWSLYPNGLDPAPLGTAPMNVGDKTAGAWVVRTRPRERSAGSPRILELGKIDGLGNYISFGEIAPGKSVTDISLVEDSPGSVWILYGDSTVTTLERRVCDSEAAIK
jgi:hypothetical protein